MYKVAIDRVRPGMFLGRTVLNTRGDALLRAGAELSDQYIDLLRARGYTTVAIADPVIDDLALADVLSDRVRSTVTYEVCQLALGLAGGAAEPVVGDVLRRLHDVTVQMVEEVLLSSANYLLQSMRAPDTYFFDHAVDATVTALLIGRRIGYDQLQLERLASGCLTRDIGMAQISTEVLNRPGALVPEEWARVRQHPRISYEVLRRARESAIIANAIALQHHERQNGHGYPQGLIGTNRIARAPAGRGYIVPDAEIAAVADVYDALGADRPHRAALPPSLIIQELERLAGTHLNRALVGQLVGLLPAFPIGSEVVLRAGRRQGERGIVVSVDPDDPTRPIVRVFADGTGQRVAPYEVDLRRERDVLAAPRVSSPD